MTAIDARRARPTPVEAVARGLIAGAAGTAALTAAQLGASRLLGQESSGASGEVGKRVAEGVFQRQVPEKHMSTLSYGVHAAYGTAWGAVYGAIQDSARPPQLLHGPVFGVGVWAASLLHLPAMKLAPPVWRYSPRTLAQDVALHLVYGLSVAATYAGLQRATAPRRGLRALFG